MDCTTYDAAIGYNEPINYNGVCTAAPVSTIAGGGYVRHEYHREIKKKNYDDEIALIIALMELDDN